MVANSKAIKKAEERRISQIGDFKNRLGGIQELPSGLIVKIRNPGGLQAFLSAGVIPNGLMAIITDGIKRGKGDVTDLIVKDGQVDASMMTEMTQLLDQIVLKTIVEPKILPRLTQDDIDAYNLEHPDEEPIEDTTDERIRSNDHLYADEIPDDDKNFLFQWISGGTRDLEVFRQQLERRLDDVSAVASTGASA